MLHLTNCSLCNFNLHEGRFLHPFDSTINSPSSTRVPPHDRLALQKATGSLTDGRIPRLTVARTLFGAETIGERFVIATGGQAPNFPALRSVEMFVRFINPVPCLQRLFRLLCARLHDAERHAILCPTLLLHPPATHMPVVLHIGTALGGRLSGLCGWRDSRLDPDASDAFLTISTCYDSCGSRLCWRQ